MKFFHPVSRNPWMVIILGQVLLITLEEHHHNVHNVWGGKMLLKLSSNMARTRKRLAEID